MEIGKLKRVADGDTHRLIGRLTTLEMDLYTEFHPTGEAAGSIRPSYNVFVRSRSGDLAPAGAAWTKTMTHPDKFGQEFLTISIDDPSFPHPLNVAAFPTEQDGEFSATWRRRQDRSGASV